jgi:transposase-like protein
LNILEEGCMDGRVLSDKQRAWLTHVEACAAEGASMKAYAEQHGLDLQNFYFWKGRLRKIGLIDPAPPPAGMEPARIMPTCVPRHAGKACIQLSNGVSIECPGDVDATALAALLSAAMRLK